DDASELPAQQLDARRPPGVIQLEGDERRRVPVGCPLRPERVVVPVLEPTDEPRSIAKPKAIVDLRDLDVTAQWIAVGAGVLRQRQRRRRAADALRFLFLARLVRLPPDARIELEELAAPVPLRRASV